MLKTRPKLHYAGATPGITDFGDSLTLQSDKDDCDIHRIAHRAMVSHMLPVVGRAALPADQLFGDRSFTDLANNFFSRSTSTNENSNSDNSGDTGSPLPPSTLPGVSGENQGTESQNAEK